MLLCRPHLQSILLGVDLNGSTPSASKLEHSENQLLTSRGPHRSVQETGLELSDKDLTQFQIRERDLKRQSKSLLHRPERLYSAKYEEEPLCRSCRCPKNKIANHHGRYAVRPLGPVSWVIAARMLYLVAVCCAGCSELSY